MAEVELPDVELPKLEVEAPRVELGAVLPDVEAAPADDAAALRAQLAALQARLAQLEAAAAPSPQVTRMSATVALPEMEPPQVEAGVSGKLPGSDEVARIAAEMAASKPLRRRLESAPELAPSMPVETGHCLRLPRRRKMTWRSSMGSAQLMPGACANWASPPLPRWPQPATR